MLSLSFRFCFWCPMARFRMRWLWSWFWKLRFSVFWFLWMFEIFLNVHLLFENIPRNSANIYILTSNAWQVETRDLKQHRSTARLIKDLQGCVHHFAIVALRSRVSKESMYAGMSTSYTQCVSELLPSLAARLGNSGRSSNKH